MHSKQLESIRDALLERYESISNNIYESRKSISGIIIRRYEELSRRHYLHKEITMLKQELKRVEEENILLNITKTDITTGFNSPFIDEILSIPTTDTNYTEIVDQDYLCEIINKLSIDLTDKNIAKYIIRDLPHLVNIDYILSLEK